MSGLSISKAPLQHRRRRHGEIGEPFEDANSPRSRAPQDLHVAARHCALNGPNLVSLSPLSVAANGEGAHRAHQWSAWLLPAARILANPMRTRLPSCVAVLSSNLSTARVSPAAHHISSQ